jgi:putative transposase
LWTNDDERLAAYRALFRPELESEAIGDIRMALDQGQPLRDSRFIDSIERATGQRREPKPRSRPRKVAAEPAGEDAQLPLEMRARPQPLFPALFL